MNKSMYSLILSDDVIDKIDSRAKLMNLSRSGLINQILAEYVSMVTPEQRMKNLYELIGEQMNTFANEFRFLLGSGDNAFTAVSALKYKYNPTIRYNVLLYRGKEHLGEIRATLRTQNAQLLSDYAQFIKLWLGIERSLTGKNIVCELKGGVYRRLVDLPSDNTSPDAMAKAITDYIDLFNRSVKLYLSEKGDIESVCDAITRAYISFLKKDRISV